MAKRLISRYMDTIGNGLGVKAANANYSALEESFIIAPGPGEIFQIRRLIVYIEANGGLREDRYGKDLVLVNGVKIFQLQNRPLGDPEVIWDVTNGDPIFTNAQWRAMCHDQIAGGYLTPGMSASFRYTFERDGDPMILEGDNNQSLVVVLEDDFSSLVQHTFRVGMIKL